MSGGMLDMDTLMASSSVTGGLRRRTSGFNIVSKTAPAPEPKTPEEARASLTRDDWMLITNVHDKTLGYNHSWDIFEKDLAERLEGRPYIFKLFNRIERDQKRIERIRGLEDKFQMRFYNAKTDYKS